MFEVKLNRESVIESVLAWSALRRQTGSENGVLGTTSRKGLEVLVRDEAEMLGGGLFPWIEGFDAETLTYTVRADGTLSNTMMLRLLALFERAVAYGVLRYISEGNTKECYTLGTLRGDAMTAIRALLRKNECSTVRPRRW